MPQNESNDEKGRISVLIELGENMSKLMIAFLLFVALIMAIVVLLILVLSAALLIFAKGDKRVERKIKAFMEPEKLGN